MAAIDSLQTWALEQLFKKLDMTPADFEKDHGRKISSLDQVEARGFIATYAQELKLKERREKRAAKDALSK